MDYEADYEILHLFMSTPHYNQYLLLLSYICSNTTFCCVNYG